MEVDELIKRVEAIAQACGSTSCQISTSEAERNLFWAGRKAAFPAVGRISPDYLCAIHVGTNAARSALAAHGLPPKISKNTDLFFNKS